MISKIKIIILFFALTLIIIIIPMQRSIAQPPQTPDEKEIGRYNIGGASDVLFLNDVAYVLANYYHLYAINVSDPTNPIYLSNLSTPGCCFQADIKYSKDFPDILFIISTEYLLSINISNPQNIRIIQSLEVTNNALKEILIYNEYILCADGDDVVYVIKCNNYNCSNMSVSSFFNWTDYYTPSSSQENYSLTTMVLRNDVIFLGFNELGVLTFDITNLSSPVLLGSIETYHENRGMTFLNNSLYVVGYNILNIINVSTDGKNLTLIKDLSFVGGYEIKFSLDMRWGFISKSSGCGLSVYDMDPQFFEYMFYPFRLRTYCSDAIRGFDLDQNNVYAAGGNYGLLIFNISSLPVDKAVNNAKLNPEDSNYIPGAFIILLGVLFTSLTYIIQNERKQLKKQSQF